MLSGPKKLVQSADEVWIKT